MNDLLKKKILVRDHPQFVPSDPVADAKLRKREMRRYTIEESRLGDRSKSALKGTGE